VAEGSIVAQSQWPEGFRDFLQADSGRADPGLRAYLLRVYNHMAFGLLLTAGVGYHAAVSGLTQSLAATHWI
jgi:FtsH-binding integral membrane protein